MKKHITILGASGSIGTQTMDIVRANPELYSVAGISVGSNIKQLEAFLQEMPIEHVCVKRKEDAQRLAMQYPQTKFYDGDEGLIALATLPQSDMVVNALVGFVGLAPTMAAIQQKKMIGLANKETLVVAGELIHEACLKHDVDMLPIDSEHSAIFQCLHKEDQRDVDKLIITASGGSFRDLTREQLRHVTKQMALAHPNWNMGAKITIDSATMMNKGFEVIEAHYLFHQPYSNIQVLLHRQSIVHSLVQFQDHSILAQLGTADMRIPIQYALSYPRHAAMAYDNALRLDQIGTLTFEPMDMERFPLLALAYQVGAAKGIGPAVMNAANEIAVARFLNDEISFLEIEALIHRCLSQFKNCPVTSLAMLQDVDRQVRAYAQSLQKGAF